MGIIPHSSLCSLCVTKISKFETLFMVLFYIFISDFLNAVAEGEKLSRLNSCKIAWEETLLDVIIPKCGLSSAVKRLKRFWSWVLLASSGSFSSCLKSSLLTVRFTVRFVVSGRLHVITLTVSHRQGAVCGLILVDFGLMILIPHCILHTWFHLNPGYKVIKQTWIAFIVLNLSVSAFMTIFDCNYSLHWWNVFNCIVIKVIVLGKRYKKELVWMFLTGLSRFQVVQMIKILNLNLIF